MIPLCRVWYRKKIMSTGLIKFDQIIFYYFLRNLMIKKNIFLLPNDSSIYIFRYRFYMISLWSMSQVKRGGNAVQKFDMKNKQNEKKKHIFKRSCQKTNDVLYDRCIKMTNGRMACLSAHSVLKKWKIVL